MRLCLNKSFWKYFNLTKFISYLLLLWLSFFTLSNYFSKYMPAECGGLAGDSRGFFSGVFTIHGTHKLAD